EVLPGGGNVFYFAPWVIYQEKNGTTYLIDAQEEFICDLNSAKEVALIQEKLKESKERIQSFEDCLKRYISSQQKDVFKQELSENKTLLEKCIPSTTPQQQENAIKQKVSDNPALIFNQTYVPHHNFRN